MKSPDHYFHCNICPENDFSNNHLDHILNNENIQNNEQISMNISGENKLDNDIIENESYNGRNNLYLGNYSKSNDDEFYSFENDNVNKNSNLERYNNSDVLQDVKIVDIKQNEVTTLHCETINGKKINISNEFIDKKFNELFQTNVVDVVDISKMQMLKKKRRRRTKKEILKAKNSPNQVPKEGKKRGRESKTSKNKKKGDEKHSKEHDDNIIKLLNSFIFDDARKCLNKSFLDENMNFIKQKGKNIQEPIKKLSPKIISNSIQKKTRIEIMNKTFKEIFSSYPISIRYKYTLKSHNKDLIEKIYKEKNQHFIIYILDMTFLDCLNYFTGQITDESIIAYFKSNYNYDEEIIRKFIGNFKKIDKLFDKLYSKHIKDNNIEEVKRYLERIKILALNYKESFLKKFERNETKKTKVSDSKDN